MQQLGLLTEKWSAPIYRRRGFISPQIIKDWPKISSLEFATFTRPNRIYFPRGKRNDGTLVLEVAPSKVLMIEYARDMIIDRVNSYFGYHAISKIKIFQKAQF